MVKKSSGFNKRNEIANKTKEVVNAYLSKDNLKTDPNGSYTGKPLDKYEKPVQDADDL